MNYIGVIAIKFWFGHHTFVKLAFLEPRNRAKADIDVTSSGANGRSKTKFNMPTVFSTFKNPENQKLFLRYYLFFLQQSV
ncbi:hypothetical protein PRIPAC_84971 [Pristionchus pacificus]|uniref:Uncharacterized protein n=1 Tax=Pristionchus pacificus TaxID=54126 RepID=A0A2A6BVD9_PRIPA|nr:hypothetical protein PRIPAC_84971 [Pristionchus pacificus]|eukprot:PDM69721.1 hypothetical protein PRIPAC_44817 [Pristionchus pacificus]